MEKDHLKLINCGTKVKEESDSGAFSFGICGCPECRENVHQRFADIKRILDKFGLALQGERPSDVMDALAVITVMHISVNTKDAKKVIKAYCDHLQQMDVFKGPL